MISKPWLQLCPWLAVSVYWILCVYSRGLDSLKSQLDSESSLLLWDAPPDSGASGLISLSLLWKPMRAITVIIGMSFLWMILMSLSWMTKIIGTTSTPKFWISIWETFVVLLPNFCQNFCLSTSLLTWNMNQTATPLLSNCQHCLFGQTPVNYNQLWEMAHGLLEALVLVLGLVLTVLFLTVTESTRSRPPLESGKSNWRICQRLSRSLCEGIFQKIIRRVRRKHCRYPPQNIGFQGGSA